MDSHVIGILLQHGDNDYSVWNPEIPADDPLLIALLDKYRDSGSSVRGTAEEMRAEVLPICSEEDQYVHVLMYYDPTCNYVGCDVFDSFGAALDQFDERFNDTQAEHDDRDDWFDIIARDIEKQHLHFRDREEYEVFYRHEKLQRAAERKMKCYFCAHPFRADLKNTAIHNCTHCEKLFCNDCYKAMTGNDVPQNAVLCPTCALETSISNRVSEWLSDYAGQMPDAFYKAIFNDVYDSSGFHSKDGFNDDDIRLGFARVVARQFGVVI